MAGRNEEGRSARGSPRLRHGPPLYPVLVDGAWCCVACYEHGNLKPIHPEHPKSPYCVEHYRQRRTEAQRRWRRRQQQRRDAARRAAREGLARGPDGTLTLNGEAAHALQQALGDVQQGIEDVVETLTFLADGTSRSTMIKQSIQHLESVDAALRPWADALHGLEEQDRA